MASDRNDQFTPTRRRCLRYGGSAVGTGLLAGCTGRSDEGGDGTATATDEPATTDASTDAETATADQSYSVRVAPAGEVTFDGVPEDVFTILTHHTDMALALGHGDAINAMHAPGYYQSLWRKFTHHLDGVTVDWEGLYSSWPPGKEKLYELDSDVHLADPAKVNSAEGWDTADVEEVGENVAPWFGNTFSDTHQEPPTAWTDDYEYYALWEIFGKVAQLFQEEARYEALADVRRSMLATVEAKLPPESERPAAALVLFASSSDDAWGYKLNHPGYYAAHTRPLGATDALADAVGAGYGEDGGNISLDYELLLEADPDVLLVLGAMTDNHDVTELRADLENHDVAGEVTAVRHGRVYTQGTRNQGPLINLFQLEMTAKQLYPEQFGEWPGYVDGEPYPEIPEDERLFDRQRVADIVTGSP